MVAHLKKPIQNNYSENLEIDRKDVNGDYEPSNCRWSNKTTQNNNTRRNHYIYYMDKKYTLSTLSKEYGLSSSTLYRRLKRGWSLEESLITKSNERRKNHEKHWSCA